MTLIQNSNDKFYNIRQYIMFGTLLADRINIKHVIV